MLTDDSPSAVIPVPAETPSVPASRGLTKARRLGSSTLLVLLAATLSAACSSSSSTAKSLGSNPSGGFTGSGGDPGDRGSGGDTTASSSKGDAPSGGSGGAGAASSSTVPRDSGSGSVWDLGSGGNVASIDASADSAGTGGVDLPEDCFPWLTTTTNGSGGSGTDDAGGDDIDLDASPFGHVSGSGGASAGTSERPLIDASALKVLDRKGWKVKEVSSYYDNGEVDKPEYAIDGDATTRWTTGVVQTDYPDDAAKRQHILIDMGARQSICQIVVDSRGPDSRADQAKEFDLYISDTATPVDVTLHGTGDPITTVQFDKVQRGRYLGIVNRGSDPSLWWSVWEINAYR